MITRRQKRIVDRANHLARELGETMPSWQAIKIMDAIMSLIEAYIEPADFPAKSDDPTLEPSKVG